VAHVQRVNRSTNTTASWTLDLPEGRREVEVEYGAWLSRATVKIDGSVVSEAGHLRAMSTNMGVDLPIDLDDHAIVVSVRPVIRGRLLVTAYRFFISVDGEPAPGTEPAPAIVPGANPLGRWWPTGGPRLVEAMSWATAGGAVLGLSQRGEQPTAILYLIAPAACSLITRRTTWPTWVMAIVCLAIVLGWIVVVAVLGAVVP
jgi:hypothetical protein